MTTNAGSSLAHWFFVSAQAQGQKSASPSARQQHAVAHVCGTSCAGTCGACWLRRLPAPAAKSSHKVAAGTHTTVGDTHRYSICQHVNSRSICRHWRVVRRAVRERARTCLGRRGNAPSGCVADTVAARAGCCPPLAAAWPRPQTPWCAGRGAAQGGSGAVFAAMVERSATVVVTAERTEQHLRRTREAFVQRECSASARCHATGRGRGARNARGEPRRDLRCHTHRAPPTLSSTSASAPAVFEHPLARDCNGLRCLRQ